MPTVTLPLWAISSRPVRLSPMSMIFARCLCCKTMTTLRLQLAGISKSYPGVIANSDVCLNVMAGDIHAVLGENGAGKSTLMKIIYGAVKPDSGTVQFNGQTV